MNNCSVRINIPGLEVDGQFKQVFKAVQLIIVLQQLESKTKQIEVLHTCIAHVGYKRGQTRKTMC